MKKNTHKRQIRKVTGPCFYCEAGRDPNYKTWEELSKYLSERARIYPRTRTGLCSKHQRKLTRAIKHARHLGLLPFSPKV